MKNAQDESITSKRKLKEINYALTNLISLSETIDQGTGFLSLFVKLNLAKQLKTRNVSIRINQFSCLKMEKIHFHLTITIPKAHLEVELVTGMIWKLDYQKIWNAINVFFNRDIVMF